MQNQGLKTNKSLEISKLKGHVQFCEDSSEKARFTFWSIESWLFADGILISWFMK